MGVSYKKLFKLLIDRGMKKKDLQEAADLSPAAVTKLAKDEYVRLDVLVRVCCALGVDNVLFAKEYFSLVKLGSSAIF